MKKRKMLSFILMGLFLLQSALPVAASEPLTEEESLIAELNQGDTLELLFFGKTIWNDEEKYEDLKDIISEMLLEFLINTGAADEETQSEEIKDLIEYAYEIGISEDVFSIAADSVGVDYQSYQDAEYEAEARDTKLGPEEITRDVPGVGDDALKNLDEEFLLLEAGGIPELTLMYKDEWYGERTDDSRIALASSILEVLEGMGQETKGYNGNTLAQAINDRYDEDAGDSVLYLALDILQEEDYYYTMISGVMACLGDIE